MKQLFLLLALAMASARPASAQTPAAAPPPQTEGFLGFSWGSSAEVVKREFAARSHAHSDRPSSGENELQYPGGRFAGFKVSKFILHFAADRFWKADVVFEGVGKDQQKEFATLRQLLIEKFGKPISDDQHDLDGTVEWYLNGPAGMDKDKVNLTMEGHGAVLKLFYAADRMRHAADEAPKAPEPPKKTTTLSVTPKAKDDL